MKIRNKLHVDKIYRDSSHKKENSVMVYLPLHLFQTKQIWGTTDMYILKINTKEDNAAPKLFSYKHSFKISSFVFRENKFIQVWNNCR